ncbi:hypothetical protein KC339_g18628 [Hortaea werneckii]|nr:hypothetical protein KC339_g18628 [Hortaea werneckii]
MDAPTGRREEGTGALTRSGQKACPPASATRMRHPSALGGHHQQQQQQQQQQQHFTEVGRIHGPFGNAFNRYMA